MLQGIFRWKPFHKMLMWCHGLIITHGSQIIFVHFTSWVKARDKSFDFHLIFLMDLLPCSGPVPACLHFNRISSALWIVGGAVSGKRLIHLKHKTPLLLASEEDDIVHLKKIKQASLFFGLPSSVSYAASMPAEEAATWPGQETFVLCGELCGLYSPFRLCTPLASPLTDEK